jgi:3-dehydroquinate synthase
MSNIQVNLANRSYQVLIGSGKINYLPEFLSNKNYSKIIILTDENVAKLYLNSLISIVKSTKIAFHSIISKAGEGAKSFANLEEISEKILQYEIDRHSLIIAFGGGVIGDLSGFLASILLRGIDFIQVPTTLLAAVDSSVGGKTAINSKFGKNLIGSFYQPKLVICDLDFLSTLPKRELKAGYAEVVKSALIKDKNFFEFLEANAEKKFYSQTSNANSTQIDIEFLTTIISKSCQIKADIVSLDETEQGQRALLNFGHSFAHIFETETNYSNEMLHGEAVSIGIMMALEMSKNFGFITKDEIERISNHFKKIALPILPKEIRFNWNIKNLSVHLYKDKKNENKNLTFILLKKIGEAIIQKSVSYDDFLLAINKYL